MNLLYVSGLAILILKYSIIMADELSSDERNNLDGYIERLLQGKISSEPEVRKLCQKVQSEVS